MPTLDTTWTEADLVEIHAYLTQSYWAEGIGLELVRRAMQGSLNFILRGPDGELAGYARVITDQATFAYLADVFVPERFRGLGHGKQLVDEVMAHPTLQGLRRFLLFTRDAHGLYAQYGFAGLALPEQAMEINRPGLYLTD